MSWPKITVIIPLYNGIDFIEQAIGSVYYEDYKGHIQIVVVDNESTDGSQDFEWKPNYNLINRTVIFESAPNLYPCSWDEPTKKGLEYLDDSEYFMFMAADDYLAGNFIENYIKVFNTAPDKIKMLQSPVKFFGKWNHEQKYQYSDLDEFKEQMLERCVVNTPTVMYHRSLYDEGLFNETEPDKYLGATDYDFHCNLATKGYMIYPLPKWVGYMYRIHDKQATWEMIHEHDAPNTIDKEIQTKYRELWRVE